MKPMPHVHSDIIHAFAEGYRIQWYNNTTREWIDCVGSAAPAFYPFTRYRLKPEPKPDVVRYCGVYPDVGQGSLKECRDACGNNATGIVKITISGETGKATAVELVE